MKEFLLYSRKGVTQPDFNLKDLPGSGGRMDLLSRCVISALWVSNDLRRDTRIYLNLNGEPDPPLSIYFDGEELRKVSPNERNIAIWVKKALKQKKEIREGEWLRTHPGIYLSSKSFNDLLEERKNRNKYLLHEEGLDVRDQSLKSDPVFVLGDNQGLPERVSRLTEEIGIKKVSLGPKSYFSSHSIVLMNNEMDREMM